MSILTKHTFLAMRDNHSSTFMRQRPLLQIQRLSLLISFVIILAIGWAIARALGYGQPAVDGIPAQRFVWTMFNQEIILISGHAGYDSGAVCEDDNGNAILTEAETVASIVEQTAGRLRRSGASVTIFEEYDPRLEGLKAALLLSIHADSCVPISGFKAARASASKFPEIDDQLIACIDQHYAATTGLTVHSYTVTHDMTEYHAYRRIDPSTPAAILETGFLGGDQEILTQKQPLVAKAITDSILCFLANDSVIQ